MGRYSGPPTLTLLQLVLHNHQEGNANHEEVEAEAHLAKPTNGWTAHLTHHILVCLLPADWRGITENNQTADEENQRNLQKKEDNDDKETGRSNSCRMFRSSLEASLELTCEMKLFHTQGEEDGCEKNHQA